MRVAAAAFFLSLITALVVAAVIAAKSEKPIGRTLSKLEIGIMLPLIGNVIIFLSGSFHYSMLGYYIYFYGMAISLYCILCFTLDYFELGRQAKVLRQTALALIAIDGIQYLLNSSFHHSFTLQAIKLAGYNYYLVVPFAGQAYHRIICYAIYAVALILSIIKSFKSPRLYRERYSVVTIALILSGALETFYIISRTPLDVSMSGFSIYGILIFYLTLYYRPLKVFDRMLALIASELNEALFFYDINGKCIWANEPALTMTASKSNDYEQADTYLRNTFGDIRSNGEKWSVKKTYPDRTTKFYNFDLRSVNDSRGRMTGTILRIRDNTEEKLAMQREMYSATHDRLTGLYTKEYLYELIGNALAQTHDEKYYIIFLDVSSFKIVNDVFGSDFGDYALKQIANWITESSGESWIYGRLGGDTFGALVPVKDFESERVERELSTFVVKDGSKAHRLLIHFGVYEVTDENIEVSVMFDRAHLAISRIKDDYNIHIAYYDEAIRDSVVNDQILAAQLSEALQTRQIVPYFQPIVDNKRRVLGAEALARWIHPTRGFMSPDEFIPVLERNGMIADVDIHIWRCACEILKRWQENGIEMFISINISPKDFYFMNVPDTIVGLVKEFGIEPSRLRIEITETVMIGDVDNRIEDICRLREFGFIIEMDDFGSGYSSLNLLQDMPVDVLKIDMAFLRKAEDNPKAEMILYNIIAMSKDLELISLTEGVESLYQFEQLSRMGCKLFQGYLFSKPLPIEEFEKYCKLDQTI